MSPKSFDRNRLMGLPEAIHDKDLKTARRQIKRIDWGEASNGKKNHAAECASFFGGLAGLQQAIIEGAPLHAPKNVAFAQSLMAELRACPAFEPYVRDCLLRQKKMGPPWLWELSVSILKSPDGKHSDEAQSIIRAAASQSLANWPLMWHWQRPHRFVYLSDSPFCSKQLMHRRCVFITGTPKPFFFFTRFFRPLAVNAPSQSPKKRILTCAACLFSGFLRSF